MIKFIRYKLLGTNIFKVWPELRDWQAGDKIRAGKREFKFVCAHPGGIIATVHDFQQRYQSLGTYVEIRPSCRLRNETLEKREERNYELSLAEKALMESKRLEQIAAQYQEPLRRELLIAQSKGDE